MMADLSFNTAFLGEATGQYDPTTGGSIVAGRQAGYKAYRLAPSAAGSETSFQYAPTVTNWMTIRFYFMLNALPSGDVTLWGTNDNHTVDTGFFWRYRASDSKLILEHRTSGTINETAVGPTFNEDEWYRFDARYNGSGVAGDNGFEWQIDGVAQSTVDGSAYQGSITFWIFGSALSSTFDLSFTDFLTAWGGSVVQSEYPFGEGQGEILRPSAAGTHVGSGSFAASTGTLNDSWQLLDNVPMDTNTSYVEQNVIGTGDYLEYLLSDLPSSQVSINGCSLFASIRSSSLASNNVKTHAIVDGVDVTLLNRSWLDISSPWGMTYRGIPINGSDEFSPGAWTVDKVNGLKLRWGYSSDVDGIPRLPAIAVEADVKALEEVDGYWDILLE